MAMRIDWMNVVVGVGAGGVDEVLAWQDEQQGRTGAFKTWTDWGRLGITLLAYLGQATNMFPRLCYPLAQSEVPLLTKSVIQGVRTGFKTGVGSARQVAPIRNIGARRISQTPKPGFENLRTY